MIVVNFAHPLTRVHRVQLEQITGEEITHIHELACQLDNSLPFAPQIASLVDAAGLTSEEWQGEGVVVNPPGYAPAATTLVAELHGRMGHFPSLIRMRPVPGSNPTQFEIAEVLNLHSIRDHARKRR